MTEQECDLVSALASEQSPTRDGVPEAVHRRHSAMRYGDGLAVLVSCMKQREGGIRVVVSRADLGTAKSASDVPLAVTAATRNSPLVAT